MSDALGFEGVLRHVPDDGLLLEFGVFSGASFNTICGLVEPRPVYGFDSFRGLPETWSRRYPRGAFSRGGVPPSVRANGTLIVGLVEDTLDPFLAAHPGDTVAFAHFDMDIYASTIAALTKLADRFTHGSVCLFDEYDDAIDGREHEQRAFAEFLAATPRLTAEFIGRRVWHAYAFRLVAR